ncbi:hypothetical protein POM88_025634 [Heracleum sosnowskyi]|uniref:Uncharacterized protein n=1 Tax=Heracleum sosnowskyi TaxID=360622 RepID=A0AAD8I5E4_9APIA|nr:hypothetical protein POM88_025634 [Heracleum sosnowskyi]
MGIYNFERIPILTKGFPRLEVVIVDVKLACSVLNKENKPELLRRSRRWEHMGESVVMKQKNSSDSDVESSESEEDIEKLNISNDSDSTCFADGTKWGTPKCHGQVATP